MGKVKDMFYGAMEDEELDEDQQERVVSIVGEISLLTNSINMDDLIKLAIRIIVETKDNETLHKYREGQLKMLLENILSFEYGAISAAKSYLRYLNTWGK